MITQKSVKKVSKGEFSDRGSKFYAFLHPIDNLDIYKDFIRKYKEKNPKACHVCSAYRIFLNNWVDEYATDDGEPKGSAGLPILNIIKKNNLVNVAIYVVRIYGGVNLGIPGLIHAYSISAENSIKDATLITWKSIEKIHIQYSYELHKIIISLVKRVGGRVANEDFKEKIISCIEIEAGSKDEFINFLNTETSGRVLILK